MIEGGLNMFAEEWPLLLFTLLTQLAVGVYVFFVIIRSLKKVDSEIRVRVTKQGMLLVPLVMLLALILSVFHLGTPFEAYRAIGNLDSSWLSREILFSGGFFILTAVTYYLDRKGSWNNVVGWITSMVGLGAIVSMAGVYANTIKPAWVDFNTYLVFFSTTIVFGAVGCIVLILLSKEEKNAQLMSVLKGIGIVALAAILTQLIYLPIYVAGLSVNGGIAGAESVNLLSGEYAIPIILRWIFSITGIALTGLIFYKKFKPSAQCTLCYTAFILVLLGEFLGRYIFFETGVSIIVG